MSLPPRPDFDLTQPAPRRARPGHVPPLVPPVYRPVPAQRPAPRRVPLASVRHRRRWWPLALFAAVVMGAAMTCAAALLGLGLVYAGGILPGVRAAGVPLGGLSPSEAAARLRQAWRVVALRDGERAWQLSPDSLGLALDADATAAAAYAQGRSQGGLLQALLRGVDVPPIVTVDRAAAAAALDNLAAQAAVTPVDAGIAVVDGEVRATPPRDGRALDVPALLARLENDPAGALASGALDLPMVRIAPALTDAAPLVAAAADLLRSPFQIEVWDPIDDRADYWSIPPQEWARWLTAAPGGALALNQAAFRAFLGQQEAALGPGRYLNADAALDAAQRALDARQTSASLRVYHRDRQHTVQPGESLIAIAWNYGVPYPWIQRANPGLGDALAVGQVIAIPSPDVFMDFPPVRGKRIAVSISQQRVRVFENGALKWDWPASTGINSSPTWPGVYQIISHVPNAYAANWNLWMPNFLGVYRPIPGQDFTNGFHGFPTRGGSQLLWTNSLGTRVTYGCILISSDNARLLYDWAENGVVVVISP